MSGTLTTPVLRHLTPADRDRIEEITRAVGVFRADEVPVALEVFDGAVAGSPDYVALGADLDGRLVGWICWGPTPCTLGTYDLYWMAVDPAVQGAGVGSALLGEMERRLAGIARLIVVETAGRPDYAPTRAFYQARGYRAVAVIPDFYAPGDDQVVYVKALALGALHWGRAASRRLPPPYPALPSLRVRYPTSIPRIVPDEAQRPPARHRHGTAAPLSSQQGVRRARLESPARLPGVTRADWESATWQRRHTIKNLRELKAALGDLLPDDLADSICQDQERRATMSMLIPPQMVNTMDVSDLWGDPVRRYMAPALADRRTDWPNHPKSSRDSLHEADMWVVEGLTHRYPTKVLAELLSTCPQYCGHCTRMDLVGNDTAQVDKLKFTVPQKDRHGQILDYLRRTPSVRDVVVSGGDIANLHITQLEPFVDALLDIPNIRDIRLASKGLIGLPQHFLQDDVVRGMERLAKKAFERGVDLALHCHANHAEQITPLVGKAVHRLLEIGFRDVRNQGVLLRGVNTTAADLVELCFMLLDHAKIMPYYFYMCDMIPNAEHWRLGVFEAQQLQHDIMGYLPGFATPRLVCDVPFVGKRWVHQVTDYDRERGISYWTKNYRTRLEEDDSGRADPDLRVLRSDLSAAGGRPGVVARAGPRRGLRSGYREETAEGRSREIRQSGRLASQE